jgi:hypothetical protein
MLHYVCNTTCYDSSTLSLMFICLFVCLPYLHICCTYTLMFLCPFYPSFACLPYFYYICTLYTYVHLCMYVCIYVFSYVVLLLFVTYWAPCCLLSKSIDSTNQLQISWCLLIRFCSLAGHVPICRIIVSRCSLVLSQWNRRWSIDWCSLPHLHVASFLRWNLCKYAFVIPCSVSTAESNSGVCAVFSVRHGMVGKTSSLFVEEFIKNGRSPVLVR